MRITFEGVVVGALTTIAAGVSYLVGRDFDILFGVFMLSAGLIVGYMWNEASQMKDEE